MAGPQVADARDEPLAPMPPGPMPMGGMDAMGGVGGLAGSVEGAARTRDVVLEEEPGAWDDPAGVPAVLGRR